MKPVYIVIYSPYNLFCHAFCELQSASEIDEFDQPGFGVVNHILQLDVPE